MATSQNGYKSGDFSLIASYTVVDDVKLSLRKGAVSVVLLHFARWFHNNIEALKKKECGGYNDRTIEGSKVISNHASGTAEDLNWNSHARGKANTFTAAEQKKIRTQLKYYEGVIRWGGDYKGTVDDMHFEINKPLSDVERVAAKIKKDSEPKPPTPPSAPAKPEILREDGILGPKTIKRWQEETGQAKTGKLSVPFVKWLQAFLQDTVDHRIKVDGDFGPKTIAGLQRYLKSPVDGVIDEGRSQVVLQLQRRLNAGRF